MVALGVHVCGNVVSDLTSRVAQADALVVRRRPDPGVTSIRINLVRLPEPDMVPLPRVGADRLFEGQIFLAPPEYKLLTGASSYGRSRIVVAAISTQLRRVSGSAGCHRAASMIRMTSAFAPIRATLRGSPGIHPPYR